MNPLTPLWKSIQNHLNITPDGIPGPHTMRSTARALKLDALATWPHIQAILGTNPDGIPGRRTAQALLNHLTGRSDTTQKPSPSPLAPTSSYISPFNAPAERNVSHIFGAPGENLVTCTLPYEFKLAWETKTKVSKITCHKLIKNHVQYIFEKTLEHYGVSEISRLKLDLYGGCFNNREKRGGTSKSMHAYGIALDIDPDGNPLKANRLQARFAREEYLPFWSFVESAGAYSLGRCKNYDWMHFQFAKP